MASMVAAEGPIEANLSVRRHYGGTVYLLQPTFYISSALGDQPSGLACDLIGGDQRFFPPAEEAGEDQAVGAGDHNSSENQVLVDAIATGARRAYWDILRRLQNG